MVSLTAAVAGFKIDAQAQFVNPGIFGTYSQFNRQFEKPILKGRAPGASKKDVMHGQEQSQEVHSFVK